MLEPDIPDGAVQSKKVPRVALVSMSNIGECPQLARALQDAGMLERWYTGLYYKPKGIVDIGRVLPAIKRRYHRAIDPSRVHTMPGWECLRLLAIRLPFLNSSMKRSISQLCASQFAKSVTRHLSNHSVNVVVGVNFTSLEVFKIAKRMGMVTFLSQRIQHPIIRQQIIEQELRQRNVTKDRFLEPDFEEYAKRGAAEAEIADFILCPSTSVIDSMKAYGVPEEKLVLLPFGVDLKRFDGTAKPPEDNKFRILYVGKVGYLKGIPYLLEAFRQLQLPDSELILVGGLDGLERTCFEAQNSVTHVDWLAPHRLNQYYLSADVFVLPSLSEGSALVSYEAMAAALPVIATSVSGTVVRDGLDGFIVPPADVEALKDSIVCLYKSPDLKRQMGDSARAHIQQFSWDHYRRNVADVLQESWHKLQVNFNQ
jgi:glycosyltransferase involved in cell wall biosynthesis